MWAQGAGTTIIKAGAEMWIPVLPKFEFQAHLLYVFAFYKLGVILTGEWIPIFRHRICKASNLCF